MDPKTGKERWAVKKEIANPTGHDSRTPGTVPNTVIITDDKAFAVEGKGCLPTRSRTARTLWNISDRNQLPGLAGRVLRGWQGVDRRQEQPTAYDPETGEKIKTLETTRHRPDGP